MNEDYTFPRNFLLWGKVGFCASNKEIAVKNIMSLQTYPKSATVGFVGIPASVICMENESVSKVYRNLTYVSVDGMPIIKKCRRVGISCERCSGPDIMMRIIEEGIKPGKTHYFYGGKDYSILEKMKSNLEVKYPGISIVGMYSPPFRDLTEEEDKKVCNEINSLHPDYVWVGIGQPKQDYWVEQHGQLLKNTTILGVGAAFDFIAGSLNRDPKIIQDAGLEWVYRFIKEPGRLWSRYIIGGLKYLIYNRKYKDLAI